MFLFLISVLMPCRRGKLVVVVNDEDNGDLLVWVSACVRNAVCLHLCFSYYRLGSPWDIEG